MVKGEWKKIGVVGVDSGQLLVCDPCYIGSEWSDEDFDEKKDSKNFSYNTCCHKTLKGEAGQLNFKMGHAGAGVVFRSGIGDGVYEVWAFFQDCGTWGKRITEVKIKMPI